MGTVLSFRILLCISVHTNKSVVIGASLALSLAIVYLNFFCGQAQFYHIFLSYSLGFVGYFSFLYCLDKGPSYLLKLGVAIGIALRIVLLFAFPQLSDDIYRFLWDGHLIHQGIQPLTHLPSALVEDNTLVDDYLKDIYPLLNSPDYFTVYPPVSQFVFYLATVSESWSLAFSAGIIKLILLISDIGILVMLGSLLKRFGKSPKWSLLYFLNPLVITEVCGQLHFESLMVFFLCGAFYTIKKNKAIAGGCLALSVGTKLLPLMFAPLFMKHLIDRAKGEGVGQKKVWSNLINFFLPFGLVLLLTFIPFFWSLDLANFLASVNLYFQSFEFNASIYYLLRSIGYWVTGYNQIAVIGPLLSLGTVSFIAYLALRKKMVEVSDLWKYCMMAFACYLFCTTTIHPWYLIMLLFFNTSFKWRWVLAWSALIILSYSTYMHPDFKQNLFLISLEYMLVIGLMIWEWRRGDLMV